MMASPVCSLCHSPLPCPCSENWVCHSATCQQPVAHFCLCSHPPIFSCEAHLPNHQKTLNSDCLLARVNALPVLHQLGPQELRRDLETARYMSGCIAKELGRLNSHQIAFDAALIELKSQMVGLELYAQELQRKRATLSEAQLQLSAEHYCRPTGEVLGELGALQHQLPELPLLSFDSESALMALALRPVVSWALETLTWAAAELQTARFHEASVCWVDDKAFVTGGAESKATWLLSRRAKEQLQDMREERNSHGVVRLQDWVYVFGGRIGKSSAVKSWERFSLLSRTWDGHGSMREERRFFTPGVYQGKIYLAGGLCHSIEVFDPASERFSWVERGLPVKFGGIVLTLNDQLIVLFDKGLYRLGAQPAFVEKEHGVCVQMHSLTTPLYTDQVVYLLVPRDSKSRQPELVKVRVEDNTVTECA